MEGASMNEYTEALTELSHKEMHPANMILAVIVGIVIIRALVAGFFKLAFGLMMIVAIAWLIYSNSPQYQ